MWIIMSLRMNLFPKSYPRNFLEWCGEEYRFFTWGNQDVMELQRNMKYYNLLKLMPGPVHYYDVQKLFSVKFEDGIARRSLEYAIDYLNLPKNRDFHRALADASYTARILLEIDEACMIVIHPWMYTRIRSQRERNLYFLYRSRQVCIQGICIKRAINERPEYDQYNMSCL